MTKAFTRTLLLAVLFCAISHVATAANDTITTLNNVHQGNGNGLGTRTVYDTVVFPHDLSMYGQIKMHVKLSCPSGGCDAWDRFAQISLAHGGQWYEIGRYITSYGKACGWEIDVTDYRYMLSDTVILMSFIDTWTNPGWLVKIDFEFMAGTPSSPAIQVENLWQNYNLVYGDTTQPITLPADTMLIRADADSVKIKMVTTGHGQGNTNNAAEFSQMTHHVTLNDTALFSQPLWRNNCNSNPCSPQNGSWTYNRAGWCPGADVIPNVYDLSPHVTAGHSVRLGYNLQSYFNNCSPHNPACVQGSTCTDCNYNYNGHTEPHYKVSGQLITYYTPSHSGIAEANEVTMGISPNPGTGQFRLYIGGANPNYQVLVTNHIGQAVWQGQVNSAITHINLEATPLGIYIVKVADGKSSRTFKIVKQ